MSFEDHTVEDLHANVKGSDVFLLRMLQERFPSKSAAGIKHSRRCSCIVTVLRFDFADGLFNTFAIGDVGAYADSFAAALVDFRDKVIVTGRLACEESYWILAREASCYSGTCARAYSSNYRYRVCPRH